jgi:5'-3' exonuclease
MILIDLNQVLLAGLMAQIANQKGKLDENLIRHMVLNIIRGHVKNFKKDYGEVVLCCDNRKYWRKDYFPFYKASRKKNRDKSDLDWHMIFDMLAKFKQELKDHFPYKVLDVEGAEADDIIGTLVPIYSPHQKILILSSDGDFLQLQYYANVKQYNPSQKKYVISENPIMDLKEKIIRGDKGDGIPNILSPGDCFVRDLRQKPITKPMLDKMLQESWLEQNESVKANWMRNSTLIDLTFIPVEIREKIINTYEETKPAKGKLLNYFIEFKLKNLIEVIEDF